MKTIKRLTTVDTNKTYECEVGKGFGDAPQLWACSLSIRCVDHRNGELSTMSTPTLVYVERQTLVDAGLLPCTDRDKPLNRDDRPPNEETPEDLLLKLLSHVGVYPTA